MGCPLLTGSKTKTCSDYNGQAVTCGNTGNAQPIYQMDSGQKRLYSTQAYTVAGSPATTSLACTFLSACPDGTPMPETSATTAAPVTTGATGASGPTGAAAPAASAPAPATGSAVPATVPSSAPQVPASAATLPAVCHTYDGQMILCTNTQPPQLIAVRNGIRYTIPPAAQSQLPTPAVQVDCSSMAACPQNSAIASLLSSLQQQFGTSTPTATTTTTPATAS